MIGRLLYAVRFFYIVTPIPPLIVPAFAVCVVAGAAVIVVSPDRAEGVLTPILLLQAFACSSGFDGPARRGFYDLILTKGERRPVIAAVQWCASAAPGLMAWLLIAAVDVVSGFPDKPGTLTSGSVAALALVSTIPWALTVRLPRFAAAVGWLLLLAITALIAPGFQESTVSDSYLASVVFATLYPPAMVGRELTGAWALIAAPALVAAACSMCAALAGIDRRGIPLEAAQ